MSEHDKAALAGQKALVAYWKKKAEEARAKALGDAQEAVGAGFRELLAVYTTPSDRRCGILDMHTTAAGALHALGAPPATKDYPPTSCGDLTCRKCDDCEERYSPDAAERKMR